MQTPAEKHLIAKIIEQCRAAAPTAPQVKILNIGAGRSALIEHEIHRAVGQKVIVDRLDIDDCRAAHPLGGQCFIASVESMPAVIANDYDLAFANYVFEHVADLNKAAAEIARVLKPAGYFVVSLPNPASPEFILARHTATKFHQKIRGRHAHPTVYSYKNIAEFRKIFEQHFSTVEIKYWSNASGYLYRFPIIKNLAQIYDWLINFCRLRFLMGNVCLVFRKHPDSTIADKQ